MTHQIRMKVYIAGPMTGLPDNNYPAFHKAEKAIRAQGLTPLNPANNKASSWQGFMRCSLHQIAQSDALYMLKDWEGSKGARLEHQLALDLHLPIFYELSRSGTVAEAADVIKSCTKEVAPGVKEGWTASQSEAALAEQVVKAAYTNAPDPFGTPLPDPDHPSTGKDILKVKSRYTVAVLDVFGRWIGIGNPSDDYGQIERDAVALSSAIFGLSVCVLPVAKPV